MPRSALPHSLSPSIRLQLMWLASPALPVGGFSYSEGLEAAVDTGRSRLKPMRPNGYCISCNLSLARRTCRWHRPRAGLAEG